MDAFDPASSFYAWEVLPPQNRRLLAFDSEEMGWWIADYLPGEEITDYQPRAWHLAGLDFYKPFVTHWMFLPPSPQRTRSDRLLS